MKNAVLFTLAVLAALQVAHVSGQSCRSYEYECDDGECVFGSSSGCDGVTDCVDGSDEENCVNLGLAIGLSVFFFILFCVVCPIVVCVVIWCCVAGALGQAFRSNNTTVRTVHTTAPPVGTPVVATTTTTQSAVKTDYPPPYPGADGAGGYPMQHYPAQQPGYPAQQPGYPAQQPGYPAQQPGYPAEQSAYPPQPQANYPPEGGYPPQQAYPPPQ